jgi:hypothetical protein
LNGAADAEQTRAQVGLTSFKFGKTPLAGLELLFQLL